MLCFSKEWTKLNSSTIRRCKVRTSWVREFPNHRVRWPVRSSKMFLCGFYSVRSLLLFEERILFEAKEQEYLMCSAQRESIRLVLWCGNRELCLTEVYYNMGRIFTLIFGRRVCLTSNFSVRINGLNFCWPSFWHQIINFIILRNYAFVWCSFFFAEGKFENQSLIVWSLLHLRGS